MTETRFSGTKRHEHAVRRVAGDEFVPRARVAVAVHGSVFHPRKRFVELLCSVLCSASCVVCVYTHVEPPLATFNLAGQLISPPAIWRVHEEENMAICSVAFPQGTLAEDVWNNER